MVHTGVVPKPVAVNCWVPEADKLAVLGLTLVAGAAEAVSVILVVAV
jgi:hypothetical protein